MQSKVEAQDIQSPELLVENFVDCMDSKGLISSMTGSIFLNPVMIKGTSEAQERGFIEKAVATGGKNPFTTELMTLNDLKNIEDDIGLVNQIKTLRDEFLKAHALHPELDKIKELLSNEIYKNEPIASRSSQEAMNPDDDDLLAMRQAGAYNPYFFYSPSPTVGYHAAQYDRVLFLTASIPRHGELSIEHEYAAAEEEAERNVSIITELASQRLNSSGLRQSDITMLSSANHSSHGSAILALIASEQGDFTVITELASQREEQNRPSDSFSTRL